MAFGKEKESRVAESLFIYGQKPICSHNGKKQRRIMRLVPFLGHPHIIVVVTELNCFRFAPMTNVTIHTLCYA